jgi:hypothetical protein
VKPADILEIQNREYLKDKINELATTVKTRTSEPCIGEGIPT